VSPTNPGATVSVVDIGDSVSGHLTSTARAVEAIKAEFNEILLVESHHGHFDRAAEKDN
jgi:hypothetical protein